MSSRISRHRRDGYYSFSPNEAPNDLNPWLHPSKVNTFGWADNAHAWNEGWEEARKSYEDACKQEDGETVTLEDVNVRMTVTVSFSITTGLHCGPVDRERIAAILERQIDDAGGIEDFIDSVTIEAVVTDDELVLARSE
jgi:hypothetical protein